MTKNTNHMKKLIILLATVVAAQNLQAVRYESLPETSGEFYLYNTSAGKYVSWTSNLLTLTDGTANATAITVTKNTEGYSLLAPGTGYLKLGYWNGYFGWGDGTTSYDWTFTSLGNGTYTIKSIDTVTENNSPQKNQDTYYLFYDGRYVNAWYLSSWADFENETRHIWALVSTTEDYDKKVLLDEKYDVSVVRQVIQASEVRLHLTLSNTNYTPVCLPFNMTETQVNEYFDEVLTITGASKKDTKVTLTTEATSAMEAAKPYLVKGKVNGRQAINLNNAGLIPMNEAQPVIANYGGLKVIGSYRAQEGVPGIYVPTAEKGVFEYRATGKVSGYSFWISE